MGDHPGRGPAAGHRDLAARECRPPARASVAGDLSAAGGALRAAPLAARGAPPQAHVHGRSGELRAGRPPADPARRGMGELALARPRRRGRLRQGRGPAAFAVHAGVAATPPLVAVAQCPAPRRHAAPGGPGSRRPSRSDRRQLGHRRADRRVLPAIPPGDQLSHPPAGYPGGLSGIPRVACARGDQRCRRAVAADLPAVRPPRLGHDADIRQLPAYGLAAVVHGLFPGAPAPFWGQRAPRPRRSSPYCSVRRRRQASSTSHA